MDRRMRTDLAVGVAVAVLCLAGGMWILLSARRAILPAAPPAQVAATTGATTATNETRLAERWSPVVVAVREGHSEALLKEVMAKIQESRAKLRTLHISGEETLKGYDPAIKDWFDWGVVARGEAWISLEGKARERVEMEYWGVDAQDRIKTMIGCTIVWDGRRTLTLTTQVEGSGDGVPRLTISAVRDLGSEASVTGESAAAALLRVHGEGGGHVFIDEYELDPTRLAHGYTLHVSRVMLEGGQPAVELEVRPDIPKLPEARRMYERYWFDEGRGYALLGSRAGMDGKPSTSSEVRVDELREVEPGIFYPVRTRGASFLGDVELQTTYEWTARRVEVNQPIAEERFRLELPVLKEVFYSPERYAGQAAATQASDWVGRPGAGFVLPAGGD